MSTAGSITPAEALAPLLAGQSLERSQARAVIELLMTGNATDAQAGAILTALRIKGETVDELTGAAESMRALSLRVQVEAPHLVDTCGTGGSGAAKLFNVSTASAFVAAAAGAHVAKHGNRAATSRSGSADVLEAAGASIMLSPAQVARCITEVGVGFMFAAAHHGAMKHVAHVRRELGFRTVFNLLGPLTNPAGAPRQLLGVFDARWQEPLARTLANLGCEHALIVHCNGLDELGLAAPSRIVELRAGDVRTYTLEPASVGIGAASHDGLTADSAQSSLALVRRSLTDVDSAAAQLVALNAGAAIYVAGVARSIADGVSMAQDAQAAGLAGERLAEFVRITSLMSETGT